MSDATPNPRSSRRSWLRIALLISLILNLLFVGLVLGAAAGKRRVDANIGLPDERVLSQLGPYGRALPAEHRKALAEELRPKPGDARKTRKELRDGFQQYLTLLRAETFDVQAVSDLLTAQQKLVSGRATAGREALLQRLAGMSAEDRKAYADSLQKVLRRGPGRDRAPSYEKRP
ncbi:periplasmic heavy metal sensor [Actibacterium pelagium]|uniref:Heavy-metal resistance n=1 Tax=Actibacterium pelagium TaxID=2029103 RepID=A0A917AKY0_9RHOB|nr:periplasmic heavy metal sensor [Actibacterium pelagium]GGE59766.1 hypothetical protein GCM10011517_29190 [Actibacterium pelagium]